MDENSTLPNDTIPNSALSNRTKGIITLIVVALYFVLPVDAIPDALIGLGQLDDIIVFAVGIAAMLLRFRATKA